MKTQQGSSNNPAFSLFSETLLAVDHYSYGIPKFISLAQGAIGVSRIAPHVGLRSSGVLRFANTPYGPHQPSWLVY